MMLIIILIIGTSLPVDGRFVNFNLTVIYPNKPSHWETFAFDEDRLVDSGFTYDEVVSGYGQGDEFGKIQKIVVGDRYIPVKIERKSDINSMSYSFAAVNHTFWIVNNKNFTNITIEDFEDDKTLDPEEVNLNWSTPTVHDLKPMRMVLTSDAGHPHSLIWQQHNESSDTWKKPGLDGTMSLRVVNLCTQQTTLNTYFNADMVELELIETLKKIQEGRIAFLTAYSTDFLGKAVRESLSSMGSFLAQHLMPRGSWAWAWFVNGPTLAEGLITNIMGAPHDSLHSDLNLEVMLPLPTLKENFCKEWPNSWTKRQHFCELYDGYDDLCSCSTPFIIPSFSNVTRPKTWHEELGVVVISSNRPRYLYRLIRQLMTQPGVTLSQIFVSVDGAENIESIKLVDLLGLKYNIHKPEGSYSPRISRHLRFALFKALKILQVDKFIIVEDDLILAPDFIMYMQQTSVLLDEDPSIYSISAFSHNSFIHTAHDLSRLNRVHSFPAYGWMVKRSFLEETLPKWPPVNVTVDWDFWMGTDFVRLGRELVVPEVSRTAHSGLRGSHFLGSKEKETFLRRALSDQADISLNTTTLKKNDYEKETQDLLISASPLNITHLFSFSFPKEAGVFAVCVKMMDPSDESTFKLLTRYLGVWSYDVREGHFGLWRIPYYHSLLLIIGVPYSKYSHGYLRAKCPILKATPSMLSFLNADFKPTMEKNYVPEDFHDILELSADD